MKIQQSYAKPLMWLSALLMTAVVAGCGGGGKDPILGPNAADPLATPDTIRPRVARTVPATTNPGPTPNVAINTPITAVFSEGMAEATITNSGSFTLTDGTTSVTAAAIPVTYVPSTKTATFHPLAALVVGKTYTATITTDAKDLAANALASNYVWTFTAVADVTPPTVTAVNPLTPDSIACFKKIVSATFSEAMAPATINSPLTTFTIKNADNIDVPGSVAYDAPTKVATFKATSGFPVGNYTATITTAATDLADIPLESPKIWNFSADGAPCAATPPPAGAGPSILGDAETYAIASTAGITNAAATTINGNVVLDPKATCNGVSVPADGKFGLCDGFAPSLNGKVASPLFPDAGVTSGAVKADLRAAYIELSPKITVGAKSIAAGTTLGAPVGSVPVQGDNYFVPGIYQSLTSILITGDVTLDAKGNSDAVFIFQSSSTIGTPGGADRILLTGGAKASNVWWWAGSAATLGTDTVWQGNLLASDDVSMLVGATSCGRLFAGASTDGAFVFDGNVVSVPGNSSGPATCQ